MNEELEKYDLLELVWMASRIDPILHHVQDSETSVTLNKLFKIIIREIRKRMKGVNIEIYRGS